MSDLFDPFTIVVSTDPFDDLPKYRTLTREEFKDVQESLEYFRFFKSTDERQKARMDALIKSLKDLYTYADDDIDFTIQ